MSSSSSTPQRRRAPANLGAIEFHKDKVAQAQLVNYLRPLVDSDMLPKGTDAKNGCPTLVKYDSATVNSKIKQYWKRLKRNESWNPADDMDPMELSKPSASLKRQRLLLENGFDPEEEDGEGDSENGILEQLLGPRVSANRAETTALATSSSASVSNVQPPRVITASPVTATTTAVQLAYTCLGNQTSKFVSNFRMHEIFDAPDKTGKRCCFILIRLPTDMQWEANIMGDGKILNYVFWPTTTSPSDFIDPNFPVLENPETRAIVTYFGNDTNSEQFRYTFALPEAVDSTCIKERFIFRTIKTKDIFGVDTTIMQKVAVLRTYYFSGQSSTGVRGLWD
ncbi:hypothetical protein HDU99_000937 [Rhizoclosmatium hyalinum]|nr:hypothetical protein HDU99_000937 [Rhizoclosmatium hyalinum]